MPVSASNILIRTAFPLRFRGVRAEIFPGPDNGTELTSTVRWTSAATLTVQDGQPLPAPLSAPD
jgi:hypothetical protein